MFKPMNISHVKDIIIPIATRIFATEGFSKNLSEFCKKIDQPIYLVQRHYPNIQSIITGVILAHIKLCETQVFSISTRSDLTPKERLQKFCDAILDYFGMEINSLIFARIYELDYKNINNPGIRMVTQRYKSLWHNAIDDLFTPLLGEQLAADMADGSMALLLQAAEELREHQYQKSCYTINTYCTELIYNWQRANSDKTCNAKRCIAWIAPHEHPQTAKTLIATYLKTKHALDCDATIYAQKGDDIFHFVTHKLKPHDRLVVVSASSISFVSLEVLKFLSVPAEHGVALCFAGYDRELEAGVMQDSDNLLEIATFVSKELDSIVLPVIN
ncbi:MAG: hypothetical protein COC15_01595 [Legionellales bacterium]|nr:MAG: hypothetical protein COC15_01595 [Legionellales bacterium]